jgi:thioesterase domain-containing protein
MPRATAWLVIVSPLTSGKAKDPQLHELERQLREAIAAELDIRAERLTYRKQRSAAWYDRQINRLSDKRDALIAARLKAILE